MKEGGRSAALNDLIQSAQRKGFITHDEIIDSADNFDLDLIEFDRLSNELSLQGILIYEEQPSAEFINEQSDSYNDYAQIDYEEVYERIVELNPSLAPFVSEVRKIRPPQWREVEELKYQAAEGNDFARQRIIEMHIRQALKTALRRTEMFGVEIEESVGNACIGLVTAVDKFDVDSSGSFSSYASLWQLQTISREQPTQRSFVYYPVHKREDYYTTYPIIKEKGCEGCSNLPTCPKVLAMIMEKLNCDEESAKNIIEMMIPDDYIEDLVNKSSIGFIYDASDDSGLNYPILEDDCLELDKNPKVLIELLSEKWNCAPNSVIENLSIMTFPERTEIFLKYTPTKIVYHSEQESNHLDNICLNTDFTDSADGEKILNDLLQKKIVQKLLEKLNDKERKIIRARFGFDGEKRTLEDIGNELGLSRERIRQIEKRALRKLRRFLQPRKTYRKHIKNSTY